LRRFSGGCGLRRTFAQRPDFWYKAFMSLYFAIVTSRRGIARQCSGAAAAELALLLPLLILMLFGLLQLGIGIYTYNAMLSSARNGARLVVFGNSVAATETAVRNQLPGWAAAAATINITENDAGLARVRVSIPGSAAAVVDMVPMPATIDADVTMPRVGDR
jgi:Flp pilus assembly protein TadG